MENLCQGVFSKASSPVVVTTDASTEGWEGHAEVDQTHLFSRLWSQDERRRCHINLLELEL